MVIKNISGVCSGRVSVWCNTGMWAGRKILTRGTLSVLMVATGMVSAMPASAAVGPLDLCASGGQLEQSISNSDLRNATLAAEAILSAPASDLLAGDRALEQLEIDEILTLAEDIQPVDLAAYCSAAGEAMRVARSGSGNRAQSYLLTALAQAGLSKQGDLEARIAYRLALTSRDLPVRPNARSARRSLVDNVEPIEVAGSAQDDENDICNIVLRTRLSEQSNWASSRLALQCASDRAINAEDVQVAALAQLQATRASLAEAQRRPDSREYLMEEAARTGLEGLAPASLIPDRAVRFDLSARLLESILDAGGFDDPRAGLALAAMSEFSDGDMGERARLHALQGRALLGMGSNEQAAAQLRLATFYESQRAQPLRLADWFLLLAEAEPAKRAEYAMQAYRALEAIRPLLPILDPITEESLFTLRIQPVFSAAVDVQLEKAGADAAQVLAAQQIVERFRQAEIQSVFGPDCVPPRIPVSPADLRDGEILFYPILLEDRIEVLYAAKVAGQPTPQYQRFTVTEGADLETIDALVKLMSYELGYGFDDSWQEPAGELYQLLFEPIEELFTDETTLVIIPDGILRRLPFAALRDNAGQMLIERTAISVAPSLAYTQPGTENSANASVVAASLSKEVELPAGRFVALEATASEARMAAGLGDPAQSLGLLLEDFTREELESAFAQQPIDVLHLATHASFNGRSDRSFIVAENGAILLSDLREMIGRSLTRGELISLIVLSACETAIGDDQASMGLAGAAVQAGSESAIASLWEVNDSGTAALMRNFYSFYAEGQGKAQALRNAQLAMIAGGDDVSDPGVWSAFTLLGAWR
ncbi:MAG: CHAT domain-containing protein [Erythrobacter sp.]